MNDNANPARTDIGPRDGRLVMRPDRRQLRSWYLASALAGTSLLFGAGLLDVLGTPWWVVGVAVAGGLALSVLVYSQWLRTTVTEMTPTSVVVRTWHGTKRTVRRESIASVVLAAVSTGRTELDYMLFLGERGRCLARASTQAVDRASQLAFAEQLGVPVYSGHWLGRRHLGAQFPGSASWVSSHPRSLGLVLGLLLILGVVAAVVVLTAIGAMH